jgi:adenylate kinase family enzyme
MSSSRRLVVIVGVHGAGKTTSAGILSELGYLPHIELGWVCRQDVLRDDPGAVTLHGDDLEWFDERILMLELERDRFVERATGISHCVETWHIGNLAYAQLRSPRLRPAFEAALERQAATMQPFVVALRISPETFLSRYALTGLDPRDVLGHYSRFEEIALRWIDKLDLPHVHVSNDGSLDELAAALTEIVDGTAR